MADKYVFVFDLRGKFQDAVAVVMEDAGVDDAEKLTVTADLLPDKVKVTITVEE